MKGYVFAAKDRAGKTVPRVRVNGMLMHVDWSVAGGPFITAEFSHEYMRGRLRDSIPVNIPMDIVTFAAHAENERIARSDRFEGFLLLRAMKITSNDLFAAFIEELEHPDYAESSSIGEQREFAMRLHEIIVNSVGGPPRSLAAVA